MSGLTSYTFAHSEYYETISRYQGTSYFVDRVTPLLPEGWSLGRYQIWLATTYKPADDLLGEQGFKIHISGTPSTALELIDLVVPACVEEDTTFKLVADPALLSMVCSKSYHRGGSGKFFTIYPPDMDTFKRLIEKIYQRTQHLDGAYILSDKRYKDSKVVFYRYGGILPHNNLKADGTKTAIFMRPDGKGIFVDDRNPFFTLPDWVEDPFPQSEEEQGSGLLNERYEVRDVLGFSNSGGVYKAWDTRDEREVVIKEARPNTAPWYFDDKMLDAQALLENEWLILSKLKDVDFTAEPIEIFSEWEHTFIVQEMLPGLPLTNYRASDDLRLLPFYEGRGMVENFCDKFHSLATRLMACLQTFHDRGILLGDLSPNNILIDQETLEVRFIDFESAWDQNRGEEIGKLSTIWSTPGYRTAERSKRKKVSPADDYYALGMALYSMMLPIQGVFELVPEARERFIDRISSLVGLPEEVHQVIFALAENRPEDARQVLADWDPNAEPPKPWADSSPLLDELPEMTSSIADHLLATYDVERKDRLWPSDFAVFNTNPLNVAYGACGIASFLQHYQGQVPEAVEKWLLDRPMSNTDLPPGLYVGAAGVAWTLLEMGHEDRALELMHRSYTSPLVTEENDILHGAAGWVLAAARVFAATGDQDLLAEATVLGDVLVSRAVQQDVGIAWPDDEGKIHHGFAHGTSGIAYALLRLHLAGGEARFLEAARAGMDFEISSAIEREEGPVWGNHVGSKLISPYWSQGAAGVGTAAIRFATLLGDDTYMDFARRVADSAHYQITAWPGLFDGVAGLGELMVDLFQATGDEVYRQRALEMAESALCYRSEKEEGLAFPGRYLLRLSTDLAHGSAGIGMFFHRLSQGGPRAFHDWQEQTSEEK